MKEILLLGNPRLYQISEAVKKDETSYVLSVVRDLHDTLMDFRRKYKAGRAIAAPQIGVFKRLIYVNIDKPLVLINPELKHEGERVFEMWDDCMSFPDLFVKVRRYKKCRISYFDLNWENQSLLCEDAMSELLQHEYDHLEGILAVSRAVDGTSFALRSQLEHIDLKVSYDPVNGKAKKERGL